jgi:hypothetical protein
VTVTNYCLTARRAQASCRRPTWPRSRTPGCGSSSGPGSPRFPNQVAEWRRKQTEEPIGDGQIFTQPWVMGTKTDPRRRTIFYQYRADRARRTLRGIDCLSVPA